MLLECVSSHFGETAALLKFALLSNCHRFFPSMKRGRTENLGEAACGPTGTSGVHALDAEDSDSVQSVK